MKNETKKTAPALITINSAIDIPIPAFKDTRLLTATHEIVAIYRETMEYAAAQSTAIAKVLGKVASEKSYEADGFKSVADYAAETFHMSRSTAYAYAKAGSMYNDETAPKALHETSYSKLAAISALPAENVKAAFESGELTPEMSQAEFKDYAAQHKLDKPLQSAQDAPQSVSTAQEGKDTTPAEKPSEGNTEPDNATPPQSGKVVETYTVKWTGAVPPELANFDGHLSYDDWDEKLRGMKSFFGGPVSLHALPKARTSTTAKKATLRRVLYMSETQCLVGTFWKFVPKTKSVTSKISGPKFTREELLAMLAAMDSAPTVEKE